MSYAASASVVALKPVIAYARTRGVRVEALLSEIGLTPTELDHFDHRIPESSRTLVWTKAAAESRDPAFGLHVAESTVVGAYDVLDYALCFSSTIGDALDQVLRYHRVLCDAWAMTFDVRGQAARLRRTVRTPPSEVESTFALLTLRARALTHGGRSAREIRFAHGAPADIAPYRTFFDCPVLFGRPTSEMIFDATDLALPIDTANPGVVRVLDRYMSEMLARLPRSEALVERVRSHVARMLRQSHAASLEQTARELRMSPRTLQRKLGEEGRTHSDIVDAVRCEMAERLVADARLSITEIAFMLGFADVSGFRRRYKHWTGTSPATARKRAVIH